jgi:hypothetical protein
VIYSSNEQDLILGTVMKTEGKITINIDSLKRKAKELAPSMTPDGDWEGTLNKLLSEVTVQAPVAPQAAPATPPAPPGDPGSPAAAPSPDKKASKK